MENQNTMARAFDISNGIAVTQGKLYRWLRVQPYHENGRKQQGAECKGQI